MFRGKTKRLTPACVRGEAQTYAPRFHPAYSPKTGRRSCHAMPVRDARLPSDSGSKQICPANLGFSPSLRSIRATHDGFALLRCNGRARHSFLPNGTQSRGEAHSAFCILHSAFASGSGVVPPAASRKALSPSGPLSARDLAGSSPSMPI